MESVVSLSAQNAGFTLIELMIVIVIVAIFVTVGVPNFQNMIKDNRLSTQANSLISSLQLARSEALKLRTPVSICRSTNGTSCAGVGNWDTGWLVFVDDGATVGTVDAGETIMQVVGSISAGNTLRADAAVDNFLSFQPNGLQNTAAAGGNFRLCDGSTPDNTKSRNIAISPTGRVSSSIGTATCP